MLSLQQHWVLNPWSPNPGQSEKTKLNCYFHTSLWCLKRFYEGLKGLKGLHKTFWGTTKKCEKKINLSVKYERFVDFYNKNNFKNSWKDR